MEEQIKRIKAMETSLNKARSALNGLEAAWNEYLSVRDDIILLKNYLNSDERRRDLEADESGKLPSDLRRGVLSQDALWNLLEDNTGLINEIAEFVSRNG